MEISRVNMRCASFPCHSALEDCTFCYCPFYPCLDRTKGKYVVSSSTGEKVWSCEDCLWIHRKDVVDRIIEAIRAKGPEYFSGKKGD